MMNYAIWNQRMISDIGAKELLDYVLDGEEDEEDDDEAAAEARAKRSTAKGRLGKEYKKTKDVKAMSIIKRTLLDEHLSLFADCKSAQELWEAIAAQFQTRGCARRCELREAMYHLRLQDGQGTIHEGEDVLKFIGRAKSLLNATVAAGMHRDEEAWVYAVLNGLPGDFFPTVNVLKSLLPTIEELTFEWVTPFLVDREKEIVRQREVDATRPLIGSSQLGWAAAASSQGGAQPGQPGQRGGGVICYRCGNQGHFMAECPQFKHERIQVLQKELAALQSGSSGDNRHGKVPRGKQKQNAGQYAGRLSA